MKKIVLILFVLAVSQNLKAQTGARDTVSYLQYIVANKSQYIHQPFSVLLNSLQIQIKYFHPNRGVVYDINKETSTRFAFCFPQTADEMYLTYPSLEIYWQSPLNASQSDILWTNNNGGGWTTNTSNFYFSAIIADIKIRN